MSKAKTFKFAIRHRWKDAVIFEAELDARFEGSDYLIQRGAAVKLAIKARADLSGAYLSGANLAGADLSGADLAGADLAGAYLSGADLSRAYLSGAYLSGANLAGADLAGAYLSGAYLSGAKWRDGITITKAPIQIYGLRWPVHILDEHMEIGCELHSHEDWAGFANRRILEMDGRLALDFWRKHKAPLLALCKIHAPESEKS